MVVGEGQRVVVAERERIKFNPPNPNPIYIHFYF